MCFNNLLSILMKFAGFLHAFPHQITYSASLKKGFYDSISYKSIISGWWMIDKVVCPKRVWGRDGIIVLLKRVRDWSIPHWLLTSYWFDGVWIWIVSVNCVNITHKKIIEDVILSTPTCNLLKRNCLLGPLQLPLVYMCLFMCVCVCACVCACMHVCLQTEAS